ncbi:MAG: hypothetical protein IKX99_00235 [Lachnospiraceae bacterium]|nr:hypothetical protein [Lachnospiraceae bacterium]MBR5788517.1 hypothetical protein [Lachnospiraceae bacterium]
MGNVVEFLEKRKQEVLAQSAALAADERKDESNVLKAKANVYDICKAFYNAAGPDESLQKFAGIAKSWEASLTQAKQYDEDYKALVEEAKLEAVEEIRKQFPELF